jgi:hypothetical protein
MDREAFLENLEKAVEKGPIRKKKLKILWIPVYLVLKESKKKLKQR